MSADAAAGIPPGRGLVSPPRSGDPLTSGASVGAKRWTHPHGLNRVTPGGHDETGCPACTTLRRWKER